ncbi:uncharacterized protein EMH_0096090 [Eimeria mitis]|uniref:Uncharacterized protein n=1 Tax=Eimeria mitis TaxID=44415 RepID=U6KG38_9EIME|nr:uncharacterized protein EMH_0096090 [Eimeria mitis]CDJ35227.1 hypothetical protein, conserved [Eimeria mitis]
MVLRSMQQQQDSKEGQMQQTSVALLPIPMTDELEQVVATLSSSRTRSRDLWDSISKLQLHLEGDAGADCWGPLPEGCVNPEPFQKPRAAAAASAVATAAAVAARAAARAIQKQISRVLPPRRSKQQQERLIQQPQAPCYFVSQDIDDKDLLNRFGLLISPKSTARLLSIFSLARRVDAAHAFIEERNEAGMILLRQAAAGIEALELSMQRSMAFVELLRPLARQQRQLEQAKRDCMVFLSVFLPTLLRGTMLWMSAAV